MSPRSHPRGGHRAIAVSDRRSCVDRVPTQTRTRTKGSTRGNPKDLKASTSRLATTARRARSGPRSVSRTCSRRGHGSGQWQHPAGGPYVFVNEQLDAPLETHPVLASPIPLRLRRTARFDFIAPFLTPHIGALSRPSSEIQTGAASACKRRYQRPHGTRHRHAPQSEIHD